MRNTQFLLLNIKQNYYCFFRTLNFKIMSEKKSVDIIENVQPAVQKMFELFGRITKPHPWHGISAGDDAPNAVTCFIESVPGDAIKYEINKKNGYLMVDRPQKFSSLCPTVYGFIPQTYCGVETAKLCMEATKLENVVGDGDPLDCCVLSTRTITHGDLILTAVPIGGFRMIDNGEADDKIICVVQGDSVMKEWNDLKDAPAAYVDMIRHYFLTYKLNPSQPDEHPVSIPQVYGREEALKVIAASQTDYAKKYGNLQREFAQAVVDAVKETAENLKK